MPLTGLPSMRRTEQTTMEPAQREGRTRPACWAGRNLPLGPWRSSVNRAFSRPRSTGPLLQGTLAAILSLLVFSGAFLINQISHPKGDVAAEDLHAGAAHPILDQANAQTEKKPIQVQATDPPSEVAPFQPAQSEETVPEGTPPDTVEADRLPIPPVTVSTSEDTMPESVPETPDRLPSPEEPSEPVAMPGPDSLQEPADTEVDVSVRDMHPGDTPMRTSWRLLGLPTFLAAALSASPALAEEPVPAKPPADLATRLDRIETSLKSLESLKTTVDNFMLDKAVSLAKLEIDVAEIKKQLKLLRDDMEALRGVSKKVVANSPPKLSGTGTIKVVNNYLEPMSVLINNQSHEIRPGETLVLARESAGAFTYEVPRIGKKANRLLAANETFTITLFPQ
jgi:hypothetical protein